MHVKDEKQTQEALTVPGTMSHAEMGIHAEHFHRGSFRTCKNSEVAAAGSVISPTEFFGGFMHSAMNIVTKSQQ